MTRRYPLIAMVIFSMTGCGSRSDPPLAEDEAVSVAQTAAASAGHWQPNPTSIFHQRGWWIITFATADAGYEVATIRVSDFDHSTQTYISSNAQTR